MSRDEPVGMATHQGIQGEVVAGDRDAVEREQRVQQGRDVEQRGA